MQFEHNSKQMEQEFLYTRTNNIVKIKSLILTRQFDLQQCKVERTGEYETYFDKTSGCTLKLPNNDIPMEFDSPQIRTQQSFVFRPQALEMYD